MASQSSETKSLDEDTRLCKFGYGTCPLYTCPIEWALAGNLDEQLPWTLRSWRTCIICAFSRGFLEGIKENSEIKSALIANTN